MKETSLGWVSALPNTAFQALTEDQRPLQMSLFDQQNLAEISHPDYPGERLIACYSPALAALRNDETGALLEVTEDAMNAHEAARVYTYLAKVKKGFRTLKFKDLQILPTCHQSEERTQTQLQVLNLNHAVNYRQ